MGRAGRGVTVGDLGQRLNSHSCKYEFNELSRVSLAWRPHKKREHRHPRPGAWGVVQAHLCMRLGSIVSASSPSAGRRLLLENKIEGEFVPLALSVLRRSPFQVQVVLPSKSAQAPQAQP